MGLGWLYVFLAAFVEIFWVLGLKYSDNFLMWTGTVITIVISFVLIIKACRYLPSGIVYAVFTGLGAASIAIIDFLFLGEIFTFKKGFFIFTIISGVIGLQITTSIAMKKDIQVVAHRKDQ